MDFLKGITNFQKTFNVKTKISRIFPIIKSSRQHNNCLTELILFPKFIHSPDMISSSKKVALDQKVSKLLNSEINEQTIKSEQRFMKAKNTPQTTKNINHKTQIKKNLFQQQKENFPEGLQTIQSKIESDLKEKTIKFVTEKSLKEKKENFQFFFNSNDDQDTNQSILTILKQKQQISELQKFIKDFETRQKWKADEWESERQKLSKELMQLKKENFEMKSKIQQKTKNIDPKQKNDNFHLNIEELTSQQHQKLSIEETEEEETVIQRMVLKVQRLSDELQYFIDLSRKLKNQVIQTKQALCVKETEIQKHNQQITSLKQRLKTLQEKFKIQISSQIFKYNFLTNQLNSYKQEYQVLKKRYFIMQAEFRKYSINLQANEEQNLREKHQALLKKYNCLYDSYKSLYEEYINRSRETDFVMELGESDQKDLRAMSKRFTQQGSDFFKGETIDCQGKAMFHLAHESLNDCSDITSPLEHLESQELHLSYHPRIILKDLIKETLDECYSTCQKD